MQHAYWSPPSFLANITKICLRVSKLWSTQGRVYNFCFRGDNYIMNTVRVVSLARDTPTGPPLHPYQILSNYLKQYGSYGLHKISASREITTLQDSESHLSCTLHTYWSSSTFLPNIIEICLRVSKLWSAQGCVYGRTEGWTNP